MNHNNERERERKDHEKRLYFHTKNEGSYILYPNTII